MKFSIRRARLQIDSCRAKKARDADEVSCTNTPCQHSDRHPHTHMASDTHKDAELASARADPAAVKKIREFTGNNLGHEEAKRLLVECDGDVQVALNRIADGMYSPA